MQGIEAAPSVGGTWYWNRYPGARCDVESVDYSYSFDEELQSDWTWTERFAAQPEILAYLDHVADRFDLRRHYLFGTEVVDAQFDALGEWVVQTSDGESRRARFLLCATGCLSAVNRPDIPGLDDFAGEVYYTAAWPREDPELRGKKIGVIGTGSSGIQVAPILAEQADSLVVFQRSPNYTIPMPNYPWSDEDLERIQREYPKRRQRSAYAPAGTPHGTHHTNALDTDPEERDEAMWRRWRDGGVLFSKTFPDQMSVLAANDIARRFAEDRIRESSTTPRWPRSDPHRPPDRDEAHLHRRGLLRDVQPRQRAAGESAPRADRGDRARRGAHGGSHVRVRCAGVRDGFRRVDGRDDADTGRVRTGSGCRRSGPTAR